jgi:hypothetical protein
MVEKFDDLLDDVEKVVKKIIGKKYKIVALNEEKWLETRTYYVKLKKSNQPIELLSEENIEPAKVVNSSKKEVIMEAINFFGEDLIEMRG